jgi:hypothetical protein
MLFEYDSAFLHSQPGSVIFSRCWGKLSSSDPIEDVKLSAYSTASKYCRREVAWEWLGSRIAVIGNVDRWYADIYSVISLAYRLSALVKERATAVKVARHLRNIDAALAKMFKDIRSEIDEDTKPGIPKPEQAREAIQALEKLHTILHELMKACKRARLRNNSLIAQPIHNIENWNEEVEELMEVIGLVLQHETVNSVYKRSKYEREHGDIFDLSEV